MKRKIIHRGCIVSAGYDAAKRFLEVEFDNARVLRVEGVGFAVADRFMRSSSPFSYWKDEIEENYKITELSVKERKSEEAARTEKKGLEGLKGLFGDL